MAPKLEIRPDRDAFDALAREWALVPVWAELLADVSTPVGLFPAVAGSGPGILLESVERSERWGRYSFVAGDPAATLVLDGAGLRIQDAVRELPARDRRRRDRRGRRSSAPPVRSAGRASPTSRRSPGG